MRTGLQILLHNPTALRGRRVGLCCNHTAVTPDLHHALPQLRAAGIKVVRLFAPEHGLHATAQDMISVDQEGAPPPDVVQSISLYGHSAESLRPAPETLADLDAVLFDIQDIGSRYYTYQATLGYLMEACAPLGVEVIVLDRPNPINGLALEGNIVQPGFESFVSAYPLAVRHGLTLGELARYFQQVLGIACPLKVIACEGWQRSLWFDQTGLPWVYPSPNMPTLDTATLYPGLCLIEGTNLSEGRGTTRPFQLVGAPWLDAEELARLCRLGAHDAGLEGVAFRAASFEPRFQKHAGQVCHGVEIFITDREALQALLLGLVVIEAAMRADAHRFAWRTETYEFVSDPIAIDLLTGSPEARLALEGRLPLQELMDAWAPQREAFRERRAGSLLYV